jgi:hypothetical protein
VRTIAVFSVLGALLACDAESSGVDPESAEGSNASGRLDAGDLSAEGREGVAGNGSQDVACVPGGLEDDEFSAPACPDASVPDGDVADAGTPDDAGGDGGDDAPPITTIPTELICGEALPIACPATGAACAAGEACLDDGCQDVVSGRSWQGEMELGNVWGTRPQVSVNERGDGVACWDEGSGQDDAEVRCALYDGAAGTWSTSVPVSGASNYPREPDCAIDGDGNVLVAWHQGNNSARSVWANRYDAAAGSWATAATLQTDTSGFSENVKVAVNAAGDGAAIWPSYDALSEAMHGATFDAGSGQWSAVVPIDDVSGNSDAEVVVDHHGDVTAVYVRGDASGLQNLYATRFDRGAGQWGSPHRLDTTDDMHENHPFLDVDRWGNVVASWHQGNMASGVIAWYAFYDVACDSWSTAAPLSPQDPVGRQLWAKPAYDDHGNVLFIFEQDMHLHSIFYDRGADAFTPLGQVDTASARIADPIIAGGPGGHAIAAWVQNDGRQSALVSHFDPVARSWGSPQPIDAVYPGTDGRSWWPQVAFDAQGRAVAVWSQSDNGYKVRSNRY